MDRIKIAHREDVTPSYARMMYNARMMEAKGTQQPVALLHVARLRPEWSGGLSLPERSAVLVQWSPQCPDFCPSSPPNIVSRQDYVIEVVASWEARTATVPLPDKEDLTREIR